MSNSDKLHLEPTPMGWTAYYDPEGLNGHGETRAAALEDLLEHTDEAWRKALHEHDVRKRALSEAVQTERERCIACLPSNWCDGLLSGPAAVIDAPPWNCPDIEAVIAGIKERMENPK